MKKIIIIFIISTIVMLTLVTSEGLYILKCRKIISKYKTEITTLEKQNKEISFSTRNLQNTNSDLKHENEGLKSILGENHPIYIRHQECMRKQNYTTAAMASCTYSARDEWYKEIDTNIMLLKNHMTKQQYNLLVNSQNKWIEYEKAEEKLLAETIGTFVGTMYIPTLAGMQEEIVKQRASDLSSLYNYMSDKYIMKN